VTLTNLVSGEMSVNFRKKRRIIVIIRISERDIPLRLCVTGKRCTPLKPGVVRAKHLSGGSMLS